MQSVATTVYRYLAGLPPERQAAMKKLRAVIKKNLPKGFKEGMGYGMIGYVVPYSIYPAGYHCPPRQPLPFMGLASQKNFVALYHMGIYGDPKLLAWFKTEYAKRVSGKLDMGKSCIRFKKLDQIPYELIAELVKKISVQQWIQRYESALKP